MKLAKPNRVKIDLSTPLCSAMESATISSSRKEPVVQEAKPDLLNIRSINPPSTQITSDGKPPHEETSPGTNIAIVTELRQDQTEETTVNKDKTSEENDATSMETNTGYVINNLQKEILATAGQTLFLQQSSQMVAPSAQIHEAITSPRRLFQVPCVPNTTTHGPPGSKILFPVTFMQSVQPLNAVDTNVQKSQSSVVIQETAVVSSSGTDEARQEDGNVDQINKPTTVTDSQSTQKLPSIDQIFKPLAQTSFVATPPSVAANVEISSLPVVGQ